MRYLIANIFLGLILSLSFFVPKVFAAENKFITIVNPVRGSDFFQLKDTRPLDNVKKQSELIKENNLSATWLIRPDALQDQEIINFFKLLDAFYERGLFMEITPTWAKEAGVTYHQNKNWHSAGSVFLTGYSMEERKKLIDSAFKKFKKEFGYFPKSVGAWWIDAGSLVYMKEKYGISASMDVADQYSTDNYQVWGQYFSTPFYPAKRNALVPTSGKEQKLGVVTIQWASRDPLNSFGNGVLDSTYSVQANDYANQKFHDLTTDYFKLLLNIYLDNPYSNFGQVTVGLENDFSWDLFGQEFTRQIQEISKRAGEGMKVLTMSEFAADYSRLYPGISPPQVIFTDDPLKKGGKVMWYQNEKYRVGWFYNQTGSVVRDLRLFRESIDEPCLEKACNELNLAMQETKNLDEVTFGDRWVIDEGRLTDIKLTKLFNGWEISYKNQSGFLRRIGFLPNDIAIDGRNLPIQATIDQAIEGSRNLPKIGRRYNYGLVDGTRQIISQFKNLAVFLLFLVVFIYYPGAALVKNLDFSQNEKFILTFPVGLAIFTLASFALGYLKIWWLIFALPVISLLLIRKNVILPKLNFPKEILLAGLVILLGSTSWLLTSIKNGLLYDFGLGFWGPHGHDAIWHLSVIESLRSGLPPENPIYSGEMLKNYHYFYDLLLAVTSRLTSISAVDLYFRFYPLLITLALGAITYLLARSWFGSSKAALLSSFFLYFGGSFGWVLSYFRDKTLGGETLFWAQQGISTLINPPLAISFLLFLSGLFIFHKKLWLIPLIILWGTLIEFKAYGGVLVLGALAVANFKIFLPILALSLIVFLPNNWGSSSLLVFSPFWLIHSMVDFPDRLNWLRLTLTRMTGFETGNLFKILGGESLGFLIFLLGNLGTRILGFTAIKKLFSVNSFNLFIISFLGFALIIPTLFIQKGANFNTIQFFYYFILIFNFMAAFSLSIIWDKWKKLRILAVLLVILLTLPTTWDTLQNYLPSRPPSTISIKEVDALQFLKEQLRGRVLTFNFDKRLRDRFVEPKPLFAYESTAYVSALSGKAEFLSDTVNLDILGVDYKGRLQTQKDILAAREPQIFQKMLKENDISYLYIPKFFKWSINNEVYGIKRIFENEEVEIFRIL